MHCILLLFITQVSLLTDVYVQASFIVLYM